MKEKTLVKTLGLIAALCGIVAFIMLFLPGISYTSGNTTSSYTNLNLVFGGQISGENYKFNFSMLLMLGYFLPLVAAILLLIVEFVGSAKGLKFIFGILAIAAFLASFIFVILTKQVATLTLGVGSYTTTYSVADSILLGNYNLGLGAIVAVVANALGVCVSGTYTVFQLLKSPKKKRK